MSSDWFWEGNVQQALASHLQKSGWTITATADTAARARGVDLLASRAGRRLAVEVKGYPSTRYARGPKAGQPKPTRPTTQAKHWFSEALLTAIRTRASHAEYELAVAFPDMPRYRGLLEGTEWALRCLSIGLYFVEESGTVQLVLPHAIAEAPDTQLLEER